MALRSVESAGVKIPAETRDLASRWLASVSRSPRGMLAGYQGVEPIILAAALADQTHVPRMRHNHFMSQFA